MVRRWLGVALAVAVVVAASSVWLIPVPEASEAPSMTMDDGWGPWLEAMRLQGKDVAIALTGPAALAGGPLPDLYVHVANDAAEAASLQDLLAAGVNVWLLDPHGHLNGWTHELGAVVADAPLVGASPDGRVVSQSAEDALHVQHRHPQSMILEQAAWVPLLTTGSAVHQDLDRDGNVDQSEPPGPFVLAAQLPWSSGSDLVVWSDVSMFQRSQTGQAGADNLAFLAQQIGAMGRIVVDESGTPQTPLEAGASNAARASSLVQSLPLAVPVAAAAALVLLVLMALKQTEPLTDWTRHESVDPYHSPRNTQSAEETT